MKEWKCEIAGFKVIHTEKMMPTCSFHGAAAAA